MKGIPFMELYQLIQPSLNHWPFPWQKAANDAHKKDTDFLWNCNYVYSEVGAIIRWYFYITVYSSLDYTLRVWNFCLFYSIYTSACMLMAPYK